MKNFREPIDAKACTVKHTEVTSKIPKAETVRYTQRTCEWKSKSKKQTNTHTHTKPNYYNTKNLENLSSTFCVDLSTTRDVACPEWFVCPVSPFEKSNI